MSSELIAPGNNNRHETQKSYLSLLQFSIYDNPYKQYPRKVKLKRRRETAATAAGAANTVSGTEFIIVSSYWTENTPVIQTRNVVVKARKKMKLTSDSTMSEQDLESPKPSNSIALVEEEAATNIIIFKPGEQDKMKHVKYSLADLRMLCAHYGIKKSGTKPELTNRIYTFLKQSYYIVLLQRVFRKFISKKYRAFSGPGYLHTSDCVNDTDFYTFDNLSKIRPLELFTYLASENKISGFHIASILGFRVSVKLDDEGVDDDDDSYGGGGGSSSDAVELGISREKQEELFIVDLFQHINTLGNYSDSEWFIVLQRAELIRFIRNIHDIWYYRANLTQEMKERICPPNGNPFVLHNAHVNLNVLTLLTDPEIRTICVSIIDRMVRRGVSREDQCLGAFYVLATLTIVNQDARNAMPWLYEAVL